MKKKNLLKCKDNVNIQGKKDKGMRKKEKIYVMNGRQLLQEALTTQM